MVPVRPTVEPATSASRRGIKPLSLAERVKAAQELLRCCGICELRCNVDRTSRQYGRCGLGDATFVYKMYPSANEEAELLPSLRVFLGACNFRCSFCDEAPAAFRPDHGKRVAAADLAAELRQAVEQGVKSISLLGGEPTLHLHTILELAAAAERRLPLALNTNMYMTPAVLELLDGVVDWYLADFKFGNDICAERIAAAPNYTAVVQRNLMLAAERATLIVRHVLLPGHMECCFRPVVDWCAKNLPGARFQLYTGYVPCGGAGADATIGRLNTPTEARAAEAYLRETPLRTTAQAPRTDSRPSLWPVTTEGEVAVTLGVDGRVYCHDLPPGLSTALNELCPHKEPAAVDAHSSEGART